MDLFPKRRPDGPVSLDLTGARITFRTVTAEQRLAERLSQILRGDEDALLTGQRATAPFVYAAPPDVLEGEVVRTPPVALPQPGEKGDD